MTMVGAFGLEPVENAANSAALAALAIQRAAKRARQVDSRIPTVKIVVHAVQLMVGRIDGVAQISLEDKRAIETILAALSNAGQANDIVISPAAAPFLERRFELGMWPRPEPLTDGVVSIRDPSFILTFAKGPTGWHTVGSDSTLARIARFGNHR